MTELQNMLQQRAALYRLVRDYFDQQRVLEVITPVLSFAANTDPVINSFATTGKQPMYLHTSPEFFMKRLLVDGSGSIYQICPVFREGESGRFHNPEFTMLEWYRVDYDYRQLMDDVVALVTHVTEQTPAVDTFAYSELFEKFKLNPHTASVEQLQQVAVKAGLNVQSAETLSRDDWLNLIMSQLIEVEFAKDRLTFVYDYPASQASLAKVNSQGKYPVAERFELYWGGVELTNGFTELSDANEQRWRFDQDNRRRQQLGLPEMPMDTNFLQALEQGLPACSGVALGLDRLLMVMTGIEQIADCLSFPLDRV